MCLQLVSSVGGGASGHTESLIRVSLRSSDRRWLSLGWASLYPWCLRMVVGKLELKSMFCLHFPFGSWHSIMKSPLLSQLDMDILVCIPLTWLIILVLNLFFLYWAWEPVQTGPCTATGRYICSAGSPWAGSQSLLWTHQYCDQHMLATHLWAVGRESLGWIPMCCCYRNLVMQKSKAHLFRSFCSDGLWKTVALKILLVCAVTSKSASCLLLNICLPGYLWHSRWDSSYKKPP